MAIRFRSWDTYNRRAVNDALSKRRERGQKVNAPLALTKVMVTTRLDASFVFFASRVGGRIADGMFLRCLQYAADRDGANGCIRVPREAFAACVLTTEFDVVPQDIGFAVYDALLASGICHLVGEAPSLAPSLSADTSHDTSADTSPTRPKTCRPPPSPSPSPSPETNNPPNPPQRVEHVQRVEAATANATAGGSASPLPHGTANGHGAVNGYASPVAVTDEELAVFNYLSREKHDRLLSIEQREAASLRKTIDEGAPNGAAILAFNVRVGVKSSFIDGVTKVRRMFAMQRNGQRDAKKNGTA